MKREAQPTLSSAGQRALDQYAHTLQQMEDLSVVTIRNYLSDLRQFMAWCECSWYIKRSEQPFTPQAISPPLLVRYRTHLQSMLWLKPSTVNRTLLSLKRYFAWTVSICIIQHDQQPVCIFFRPFLHRGDPCR